MVFVAAFGLAVQRRRSASLSVESDDPITVPGQSTTPATLQAQALESFPDTDHPAPPVLEGQSCQFVGSPNRYTLAAFLELHVWAWRENPNGAFVDWNTRVTCEGQ
jgi:hypothetical protein